MSSGIVIVDYGVGNLRSVINALRTLGHEPEVGSNPRQIALAPAVILPGVGAGGPAMEELEKLNLADTLRRRVGQKLPLLGVCLGLQLLMSATVEGGLVPCLGIVAGLVKKLPEDGKIPHMGWNQVKQVQPHAIFQGIPDNSNFYFVHSYYAEPEDESIVVGKTEYGVNFCSVLVKDNLVATQFHPEKSGEMGLRFYNNFIKLALRGSEC
jgi:imidazole glycerol-phosphate synthase subunit HisH